MKGTVIQSEDREARLRVGQGGEPGIVFVQWEDFEEH